MPRFRQMSQILELMKKKECIRNVGIIAHIDHGKTTMADSLLLEAGLLPSRLAGSVRALDYLEEEQKRGITIKTANISLVHSIGERAYVINLIDTPGHVDFAGKVARALRATDGAVVVVDSVEEIMAQTETVTRQALQERVKPILFINKVDRLIKEIGLSPQEIQKKFSRIINDFNSLVEIHGEPEFRKKWKVDAVKGSVAFGSALHKWGFTLRIMKEKGKKFSDIIDAYEKNKHEEISRQFPLHNAILDMVVAHVPDPVEAQRYRVPKIWRGDLNSEIGQSILTCNEKGPTVVCLTAAQIVPKIGLIATGRVFSGSVKKGDRVYLIGANKEHEIQEVSIYMSAFREAVGKISAGNIAALTGLEFARAGDTVVQAASRGMMAPFESVSYVSQPVMTVAIEPRKLSDLPKLAEAGDRLSIEDPNIAIEVDEHSGQYLLSGLGELHLEIAMRFLMDYGGGIELAASEPIVAFREGISARGKVAMARSPDKQNMFWVRAQPLASEVLGLIEKAGLPEERKLTQSDRFPREKTGYGTEKSAKIWDVDVYGNMMIGPDLDLDNLGEVKNEIILGFRWACKTGPLCEEPLRGVEIRLIDAVLSKEEKQRESAQVSRAISRAVLGSCLTGKPILLEPIYKVEISTPTEFFGTCTNIITGRRGRIEHVENKGILIAIRASVPVIETFGLAAEIRSLTSGRAFWQLTFDRWERTPMNVAAELIKKIRKRRGLPADIPKPAKFVDEIQA